MPVVSPNFIAGGDINPSRFVTISAANAVTQSVGGELPIGISTDAQRDAPIPGASTLAASAGQAIRVHGQGEECLLLAGSGGWSAGNLLTPDADGKGIVISSTANDQVGAVALGDAAAGELGRVQVQRMKGA